MNSTNQGLWETYIKKTVKDTLADDITLINTSSKTSDILKKINSSNLEDDKTEEEIKRYLKSKTALNEKLIVVEKYIQMKLGMYQQYTQVIKDRKELHDFILAAIENGYISVDTETDNSVDPLTCKLMGVCLYIPQRKRVYVPINHTSFTTKELIANQLTERDIYEELSLLITNNCKVIMHSGKFDYQVLKCTCGLDLPCYWDTQLAAKIIDENYNAKLKVQFRDKVDSSYAHYNSISDLSGDVPYTYIKPDIFALYASADAFMTYKLYEWQLKFLNSTENTKLKEVLSDVEMLCLPITAEMELRGVFFDTEYTSFLSHKYNSLLQDINKKIEIELDNYKEKIDKWRLTPEANKRVDNAKSKSEQLKEPINLSSPVQLAILLYDVLKVPPVNEDSPRSTDETTLSKITGVPLCSLIVQRRETLKLLTTYIDNLPEMINPKTGRIHCNFNQYGAKTGRYSSSEPNLQNIPSHNKEIRLMFSAQDLYENIEEETANSFILLDIQEVETMEGWKFPSDLKIGDIILGDNWKGAVSSISNLTPNKYKLEYTLV